MAKVTITIEDRGKSVNVSMEFDPPAERKKKSTGAQIAAIAALDAIQKLARGGEDDEEG